MGNRLVLGGKILLPACNDLGYVVVEHKDHQQQKDGHADLERCFEYFFVGLAAADHFIQQEHHVASI